MSRLKIFNNLQARLADWWDRSIAFRYHIPGLEIGTSKEHSLLEYKSDLNDPEYWQAVPTETKPEPSKQKYYDRERKAYSAESGSKSGLTQVADSDNRASWTVDTEPRKVPKNVFGKDVIRRTLPDNQKLIDPLGSPGISGPVHNRTHYSKSRNPAEVFETQENQYIKGVIHTSWREDALSESLHKVRVNRKDEVNYVSELYPDSVQVPRMYIQGEEWATGSKKLVTEDLEKAESNHWSPATSSLSKNQRFKIDTPTGIANAFYGKPNEYKGEFEFPGGTTVSSSLEYNLDFVEKELGLIPFCITTITPDHRTYLNFPAHLDSYDDSYTGDWDSVQYVGRAEKFYGYTGFTREINVSFKVISTNPQNLANMYSKLNRLAGGTAPSYTQDGLFMRGTLASLTIGDLLRNQTGFIRNVKLSWEQDYLWELGPVSPQSPEVAAAVAKMYGVAKEKVQSGFEGEYYRVPQVLNVSLGFTPIEHGVVREDYNAYFVFDNPKELKAARAEEEHKEEKKEASATITLPNIDPEWHRCPICNQRVIQRWDKEDPRTVDEAFETHYRDFHGMNVISYDG